MAREFNNDIGNYLSAGPPLQTGPCTLAAWIFNLENDAHRWLTIGAPPEGDIIIPGFHLRVAFTVLQARMGDDSGLNVFASKTGFSNGVWHHAAGVFTSTTSRQAFVDGVGGTIGTTSRSFPTTLDGIWMGVLPESTFIEPAEGRLAEVGVWNVALTDAEIASLASGVSPLMVRPQNLVGYWPLYTSGAEPDWVGENPLTETGTVVKAAHPPLIVYPHIEADPISAFWPMQPDWVGTNPMRKFGVPTVAEHPPQIVYPHIEADPPISQFWPLEPDWVGDAPMRVFGTVLKEAHPPQIVYPNSPQYLISEGVSVPVYEQLSHRFRFDDGGLKAPP